MENNKNYQKYLQNELKIIENYENKLKLLLHACCGPCFTIPYEILKDHFEITILYNNSNILCFNSFNPLEEGSSENPILYADNR